MGRILKKPPPLRKPRCAACEKRRKWLKSFIRRKK